MKIDEAIVDVQRVEATLARKLRAIGERHAAERDVYRLTHTLASQCDDHLRELVPMAARYGAPAFRDGIPDAPSLLQTVRHNGSEVLRRSEASGALLLNSLRKLYLAAQEAEIAWVILGEGAQAVRDPDLLEVTSSGHEHAEAGCKWLRTRIKESALLATG